MQYSGDDKIFHTEQLHIQKPAEQQPMQSKQLINQSNPSQIRAVLLALSVGRRLCINFSVSRANFQTTLRSHLDVTCSCYFWSSLFTVDVNYSYIYIYLVNYNYFGSY